MATRGKLAIACALALALAPACNQVFSLDPPRDAGGGDGSGGDPDRDHDGWPNLQDDCPDAADPLQHDEDGDGVGDVCDDCPGDSDEGQADAGDGDGVGDRCDPDRRAGADDHIAFFDGFGAQLGDAWAPLGGAWSVSGDHLDGGALAGTALISTHALFVDPRVDAAFRFAATAQVGRVAIMTHLDASTPTKPLGYACEVTFTPTTGDQGSSQVLIEKYGTTAPVTMALAIGPTLEVGKTYFLIADQLAGSIGCTLTNQADFTLPIRAQDGEFSTGTLGFRLEGAAAEIDHVTVFR